MGTSRSKSDPYPEAPFIPPWAGGDPPAPPPLPSPPAQDESDPDDQGEGAVSTPQETETQSPQTVTASGPIAPPRRYANYRRDLGRYARTGDISDARSALGSWARVSSGGAAIGTRRAARTIAVGGAALAAFSRAIDDRAPAPGALDIRSLSGLPVDSAIGRIIDAFCPTGILDEETARTAMGQAISEVLAGADVFDPNAIDDNAARTATLRFVAEVVFIEAIADSGASLASAITASAAVERENNLRALIREVADSVGSPIVAAQTGAITPSAMKNIVSKVLRAVKAEVATW